MNGKNRNSKKDLIALIKEDCIKNGIVTQDLNTDIEYKIPNIDYKNLKELYIVYEVTDCDPVIIKCPVVESTLRTVTIKVKDRYKDHSTITESGSYVYITGENYHEIKIKKEDLNKNFGYRASTLYSVALAHLLLTHKDFILFKLCSAKNTKLYERFILASTIDLIYGLEYIAKYLKMVYLFKLEDDTKITYNVDNLYM